LGTTIIKTDRLTLAELTAEPASVVSGDLWYRADLDTLFLAIDTVVANSKELSFPPFDTGDIVDGAITTPKIADSAVTLAKAAFADQELLTTSTVTFAEVRVADLSFEFGWKITETEEGLVLRKDGEPVLLLGFDGLKLLKRR